MVESIADEEWRPIPGYEDLYEASDQGRVRSLDRRAWRLSRGTWALIPYKGRVLKWKFNKLTPGVPRVILSRDGTDTTFKVAVLVMAAFHGERPTPDTCVCHWNDIPTDNRLSNLRYGTKSENGYDRVRNGLHFQTFKDRCPRRHLLREPNLVPGHRGRTCLACSKAGMYLKSRKHPDMQARSDWKYREIMGPGGDPEWEGWQAAPAA